MSKIHYNERYTFLFKVVFYFPRQELTILYNKENDPFETIS